MRSKEFTCPNCGGSDIIKINRKIVRCRYCDTLLSVSYDPEESQMDMKRSDITKDRQRNGNKHISLPPLVLIGLICALFMCYQFFYSHTNAMNYQDENASKAGASITIYETGYVTKISEIPEDTFNSLEDTASEAVSSIYLAPTDTIELATEPELIGVYLLCNKDDNTNMLYFSYHVTWARTLKNEDIETIEVYPAIYFSNLMTMSDGSVQSDFRVWDENPSEVLGDSFVFGYKSKYDFYNKCISSRSGYKVKKK